MILNNIRKIFVLGDLHLGIRNASIEWSNIQVEFLLDFFLSEVDKAGFDPETDILVQVGDWHHVRESTNIRILDISLKVAKAFSDKFKRGVFVILGNHDVYYKDQTDIHSLKGFDQIFDNFHIYETPELLTINSHKVLMLPWIESVDGLNAAFSKYSKANYVFCHADVKGASLSKTTVLEHGVDVNDLASFKRIYSGHIHIHQNKQNLLYVGTPYEMDRGDRGNPKGFYILEASAKDFKETFIENTVSPKHIRLDILTLLNLSKSEANAIFANNFVDISIASDLSARFPFSAFTELVKDFGHRRLEFYTYSKEQTKLKSSVELNENYEYNIFNILKEKLDQMNLSNQVESHVLESFKKIYDSVKNTKKYDQ